MSFKVEKKYFLQYGIIPKIKAMILLAGYKQKNVFASLIQKTATTLIK